jgi:FO synthase
MNESISRAAGTLHGQETSPVEMLHMIERAGRQPRQRSTAYGEVSDERVRAGLEAAEITEIVNTPARKYERAAKRELVRPGLIGAVEIN